MSRNIVWITTVGDGYRLVFLDAVSGAAVGEPVTVPLEENGGIVIPSEWSVRREIPGARVFLDIPLKDLYVRFLDLPLEEPAKVREVLPFEAEGLFLSPLDDMVLDVHSCGRKDGSLIRHLVVGAKRDMIAEHIRRLNAAGIDPDVIGSSDLAGAGEATVAADESTDILAPLVPSLPESARLAWVREVGASGRFTLRRGHLAETRRTKEEFRKRRRVVVLALVLLVTLLGNWGVRYARARGENTALENRIRTVYREIDPESRRISDEVYQAQIAIKNLEDRVDALSGVPALDILAALARGKKDEPGIVFKELLLRKGQVTAIGTAPSFAAAERFKEALRESAPGKPRILETTVIDENQVRFTLAVTPEAEGREQ